MRAACSGYFSLRRWSSSRFLLCCSHGKQTVEWDAWIKSRCIVWLPRIFEQNFGSLWAPHRSPHLGLPRITCPVSPCLNWMLLRDADWNKDLSALNATVICREIICFIVYIHATAMREHSTVVFQVPSAWAERCAQWFWKTSLWELTELLEYAFIRVILTATTLDPNQWRGYL